VDLSAKKFCPELYMVTNIGICSREQ